MLLSLVAMAVLAVVVPTAAAIDLPLPRRDSPASLLVRIRPELSEPAARATLSLLGARVERSIWPLRILVVAIPESAVAALRASPAVEEVEPVVRVAAVETSPNDVHWPGQWGLRRAGFAQAWDVVRGSPATLVAVVDTGVDRTHPDLRGAVAAGHDFVDDDADPADEHGHGTAVAGIVAARANNRVGIAGTCWRCRVLPVRVLGRDGGGDSGALAAGVVWAVDHGASVINLSLGGDSPSMGIQGALDYAARHDVVVVAAAGNEGGKKRFYPAAGRHAIAVAATDSADRLYPWSNRGDWVELAAPGCNTTLWLRNSYATVCGTSSAAPLVAGFAALIRSADPRASAAATARRLEATARPLGSGVAAGRLDAANAFRVPVAAHPRAEPPLMAAVRRVARRYVRR